MGYGLWVSGARQSGGLFLIINVRGSRNVGGMGE